MNLGKCERCQNDLVIYYIKDSNDVIVKLTCYHCNLEITYKLPIEVVSMVSPRLAQRILQFGLTMDFKIKPIDLNAED